MAKRLCKCGCGEEAKSNASPYAKGHNPASMKEGKPRSETPRQEPEATAEDDAYELTITVATSRFDAIWARLTTLQKATALQAALEVEADPS